MSHKVGSYLLLNNSHATGSHDEHDARHDQHVNLRRQTAFGREEGEDASTQGGGYNLGHADGAVEEAEVRAHVPSAERVGQDGERQGKHGRPGAPDEDERDEQQVLVMNEVGGDEPYAAQREAEGVDHLTVLEQGDAHRPQHRPDGLHGEEHAHPVGGLLILKAGGVQHDTLHAIHQGLRDGRAEHVRGNASVGVRPHEHEGEPAEELHQPYRPECLGRTHQQAQHADLLFLLLLRDAVVFGVFLRGHFLHLHRGVDDAEDEDGGADVERPDDRVRYDALRGGVLQAHPGEEEGEEVAHEASGVAQETLDGVGQSLLLFVHHVAHHHLERLHGHINRGVEKHQCEEAEHHGGADAHAETARVGQEAHHQHGDERPDEQVGDAPSEAAPRLVAGRSHEGLHQDARQRGQYPEIAQTVRIGAKGGEYPADVGTLQGVGYLYAEETEADVPQLPET